FGDVEGIHARGAGASFPDDFAVEPDRKSVRLSDVERSLRSSPCRDREGLSEEASSRRRVVQAVGVLVPNPFGSNLSGLSGKTFHAGDTCRFCKQIVLRENPVSSFRGGERFKAHTGLDFTESISLEIDLQVMKRLRLAVEQS